MRPFRAQTALHDEVSDDEGDGAYVSSASDESDPEQDANLSTSQIAGLSLSQTLPQGLSLIHI